MLLSWWRTGTYRLLGRYFLVALRSIVLKGTGAMQLLPEFGALALYAMVMLGLASLRLACLLDTSGVADARRSVSICSNCGRTHKRSGS